MPSGPFAECESRFDSKLSILSGEKDTESRNSWVWLGKVGTESDGFGTQYLEVNTEVKHSAFLWVVSLGSHFWQGRDGGEHAPEMDLTKCHQNLEEGDRF